MQIPESILSNWRNLVADLKPAPGFVVTKHDEPIDDTVYPTEEAAFAVAEELGGLPYGVQPYLECITVGYSPQTESWGYQTGDNSFTGGAYGHPFWGVVWIGADADPAEVADEIAGDILSQVN